MRHLDTLRNHPVPQAEQEQFNIIGSNPRLLVDVPKNIMILCGSGKGARFTTEDLLTIRLSCAKLEKEFRDLDDAFKKLGAEEKKSKGGACDSDNGKLYVEKREAFLAVYATLASLVSAKRESIADLGDVVIEMDPEAEMKHAQPLPEYLVTLIAKYGAEQTFKAMSCNLDTLSRFSAYLAAAIVGEQVFCSEVEAEALLTLISASADGCAPGAGHTEKYWRERVFGFLSKLREVKSVPKKEKDLHGTFEWWKTRKVGVDATT
jgi:hypothetical protein